MVAITCALYDEAYEVIRLLKKTKIDGVPHYVGKLLDEDISLFLTKPGFKKKSQFRRWLKLYDFDFIIHTGFAGALKPHFAVGELCHIHTISHSNQNKEFQTPDTKNNSITTHKIVTAKKPVITINEKEDLAHKENASFVDMELWNLFNFVKSENIITPILPVKIIGDLVGEDEFLEKEIIFRPYFSSRNWKIKLQIIFTLGLGFIPLYKRKRFLQKTLLARLKDKLTQTNPKFAKQ